MTGQVVVPTKACKGFDCNEIVALPEASHLRKAGYSFGVRYIKRVLKSANDLSKREVENLFLAGLAVMPVQHVESTASWVPSADKGKLYGNNAVEACIELRVPKGVTVWLDLEGVSRTVPSEIIIKFCNYWYGRVESVGYQPGIYVGWRAGLSSVELYKRLKFERYWGAYNLNSDEQPAVRGNCMKQKISGTRVSTLVIDDDFIIGDNLGGFPALWAPDEWQAL